MSKSKEQKIADAKAKHPAFQQIITNQQAFDINTIVRYDLYTGLFSVSADIDDVDTIYDAKFGGWRKPENDAERNMNQQIINTLASVCVMLNQMVEVQAAETGDNNE